MGAKTRVGIIGCGNIFPAYIRGSAAFEILEVVACADMDMARAQARADEFGLRALTVDDLIASQDVDIIVNLTIPAAHAEVSLMAIEAGKHVYEEKPFAITREDGQRLLAAAEARGVRIGCAPDTFLGGGLQTCRKLIDDGWIGTPVAAAAFMLSHGPESWHPSPDFFYKVGGGPMFDMGPYYLTALIHLLGPVERVAGSARVTFPERIATSQALFGHHIGVEIPTHVTGIMDFAAGPVATITTSFDIWGHSMPRIEIYGSAGSLSVPDPNTHGGPVYLRRGSAQAWQEVPLAFSADVARGIGVADMAYGLRTGRPHRASGQMAYHVLDLMHAFHDSSNNNQHVMIESTCDRPAPLPLDLMAGRLDD
jgi:predicted dehydrogenase